MNILVIGGSGLIGFPLVEQLLAEGHEVTYFSRGNVAPNFSKPVNHIKGDRHSKDFPSFFKALKFDIVIDNLVFNRENAQSAINAFNEVGIKQYLFTSSAVVYEDLEVINIDESATIGIGPSLKNKHGERVENYCKRKIDAENVFWNALKEQKIKFPFTILRPTVIEGKGDPSNRPPYWLKRISDGYEIVIIKYSSTYYQHVFSQDVASAFLLAINNKKSFNQAYNIAGSEILEQPAYIYQLAAKLNKLPKILEIPHAFLEQTENNFKIEYPPLLNNIQLRLSIKKAEKDLQFKPTPRENWVNEVVKWYVEFKLDMAPFYDKREDEIKLAKAYLQHITNNSQETVVKILNSSDMALEPIHKKNEKNKDSKKIIENFEENTIKIENKTSKATEFFELKNNETPNFQT